MALTITKTEAFFTRVQFTSSKRLFLYQKISSFLDQGVPIHDILDQLAKNYAALKKSDIRATILKEWVAGLSVGRDFSTILGEWVPAAEAMLIRSGEKSGSLSDAFRNACVTTEASGRMKETIFAKLSYPAVLFMMLFGLIYMFSTKAIPPLVLVKDPETWPPASKNLYTMSTFVENYWLAFIVSIVVFVIFVLISIPRLTGFSRRILDRLPPWNIYKTFQSAVFLVSIAAMMRTGTPLVESIQAMKRLSNPYVTEYLKKMLLRMDAGRPIGEALNVGFFTNEMGMDIKIYGEVSNIQGAMDEIGRVSIEDGIKKISSGANSLKNIAIVGVGTYVMWVYYSFWLLTQAIGADAQNL